MTREPRANGSETERVRGIWERMAPSFDRKIDFLERVLFKDGRSWVCSQARGETLEIAVGTGRNIGHYPPEVKLTGTDISPAMLDIARARASELGRQADLRVMDAQHLDFPDGSFDTVVVTLALCSIPDDRRAVTEMKRVLRPGGRLLLMEHVRSTIAPVRLLQRLLDPLMVRFEGDHQTREPLEHLGAEGFAIERLERYGLGVVERVVARRP